MGTYIELFLHFNDFIFANRENKRNKEQFCPITVHCDFEIGLIGAIKQVWPNCELKLCLWHLYRNLETNRI